MHCTTQRILSAAIWSMHHSYRQLCYLPSVITNVLFVFFLLQILLLPLGMPFSKSNKVFWSWYVNHMYRLNQRLVFEFFFSFASRCMFVKVILYLTFHAAKILFASFVYLHCSKMRVILPRMILKIKSNC